MNQIHDVILGRQSVRDGFGSEAVAREELELILDCGLAAPSSKNARPWRFHVVSDRTLLAELASLVEAGKNIECFVPFDPETGRPRPEWESTVRESAAVLRQVSVGIFVENTGAFSRGRRTLLRATHEALAGSILGYTLELMGVGAAVQSLWLAAEALGLSGVFIGDVLIAEDEIRERLGVENDLVGVLALGYASAERPRAVRQREDRRERCVRWVEPSSRS